MKIGPLSRTTFPRVHAYDGVSSIESKLLDELFVVVDSDDGYAGVLSPEDLVRSPRALVADCLRDVPVVHYDDNVSVVLDRMRDERMKVLPVFRHGRFHGVCVRSDIAEFLETYRQELEEELARRTAELKLEVQARREAESALRQSEARYREIVETASEGIWILDREFHTTFVNPQAAAALRSVPDELVGMPFEDFVVEQDRFALQAILEGARRGIPCSKQVRLLTPSGETRWVLASVAPRRGPTGEVDGAIAMLADVTNVKQLEETVFRAHKMEAIGTMAAGIAHDINNVLTPIMVHAELLQRAEQPALRDDHAKQILHAASRIRAVTQRLLALSKQQPQEARPLDLHAVVAEGLQLLRASLPTTIEMREIHVQEALVVRADATQLHQVLLNLCANAHHAMRTTGGVLEVRVDRFTVAGDEHATRAGIPAGDYARLIVGDTGSGMAPEVQKRMFEPYFTTKAKGEGSGLGLAVVHGIASAFGGHVTVESELRRGSTFSVWLPLASEPALEMAAQQAIPRGGCERVLLVDDEAAVAVVCEQALEARGYRVTTAESSLRALELLQACPVDYDLLLTDETMPRMSGVELAKEARKVCPGLRVLLMSGGGFGVRLGTDLPSVTGGLLCKPFTAAMLLEAVRRVLDEPKPGAVDRRVLVKHEL